MASVNLVSLPPTATTIQQSLFFNKTKNPLVSYAQKPFLYSSNPSPFSISATRKGKSFLLFASDSPTTTEVEVEEGEDEGSRTRILAQNVPWSSTADDLRPLFEKFGTVVEIELSMYNKTRNRGLAFVTMGSNEEASAAISKLESSEYEGRTLKLTWAYPKKKKQPFSNTPPKPAPIHNLYVANLPFQARAKDLREFFTSDSGSAVSAEIIFQENPRRSAGYGFVSFYTKEEAEAALSAFQGKVFMGRSIRVAPSKKFLRQGTKESIQADTAPAEISAETELVETAN